MAVSLLVYLAEKLANYIVGVQENLGSYTKHSALSMEIIVQQKIYI